MGARFLTGIWSVFFRSLIFLGVLNATHAFGGDDQARAITLDSSENVYVTGNSEGAGTRDDFFTIKYDAAGAVKWSMRFDGSASNADIPNAIAVDNFGNVYVTGSSLGLGTGLDYATVKYNSNGVFQWAAIFDGTAHREDIPYALAVDSSGNVYVTGSSQSSAGDRDFVTIKYNANGAALWTMRWDGGFGDDIARALKIDNSGNVYVAGSGRGNSTGLDFVTIKYNRNGVQQWLQTYNGPGNGDDTPSALALDAAGNVYLTGSSLGSTTGSDYATLNYTTNGVLKWVARYDGPGNGNDRPTSIAVDGSRNVYVTGSSLGSNGTALDYATIKYQFVHSQNPKKKKKKKRKPQTGAVQQVWVRRVDGPVSGDDVANALALDSDGSVCVTGTSLGSGSGNDYLTLKYNPAGAVQWTNRFDGTANSTDKAAAIAVDGTSHNVYVTGESLGVGTGSDFATVKYDANGNFVWTKRFDQP
jgi:uncharacterized delta-60 repeat protein